MKVSSSQTEITITDIKDEEKAQDLITSLKKSFSDLL